MSDVKYSWGDAAFEGDRGPELRIENFNCLLMKSIRIRIIKIDANEFMNVIRFYDVFPPCSYLYGDALPLS